MITAILFVAVFIIILVSILRKFKIMSANVKECIDTVFGLIILFASVGVMWSSFYVLSGITIQPKIDMYMSENKDIEKKIDTTVENYMEHENKTFEKAKGTDSMTLISLYPELKSDELVKEQIRIYTKNNDKIKQLKEDKIEISMYEWLLYFGG
ncbi:hypothetical protein LP114_043 [Listeria phage LP-114]|uniref:Uncharacterized protein n=2 Tax=Homburgvirus TaxID=1921125 RepID=A0A6C0R0P2_9CAUD|nr:hypothetical protein LP114_043 [Listeria phage LP-114]AHL18631.1 hypothetical protein LP114_043 [Listeria phage LP-114]QHZ59396.1 hypothetical protein FK483_0053 [Listeria phage LP-018]